VPSNRRLSTLNRVHHFVIRVTRGALGWRIGGMPVLELTTTGRRSGQQRSVLLSSPLRVGSSYVVVASRGGDDEQPAWFLNLRENPHVEVVVAGSPKQPMLARVAGAAERARLWPLVTAKYPGYARYQARTSREIPLVLLTPP
jgi:deazaflavin-dependent oxidoreductase (nitroreductase family)